MSNWRSTTLQEIISTIESGSRPKGGVRIGENSEGIPSYGGENISMNGGMLYDSVRMVPAIFAAEMKRGILSDRDVLINKDGANTGKSAIYRRPAGEEFATINEHLFLIRCDKDAADQGFLYHFLNSELGKSQIARVITGSAQPGLNSTFPEFIRIDLPPLPEQKKIAEILSGIDKTIDNLKSCLCKQQILKKSLLGKLIFHANDHFGSPNKTKNYCLGDISTRITDGTHQAVKTSKHGTVPFLYVSCVKDGIIDWSKSALISEEQYAVATQGRQPSPGDILYTAVGSYGNAAMVASNHRFCFQRHIALIQLDKEMAVPKYIELALSSDQTKKSVDQVVAGNAQPTLTLGELRKLQIPFPSLETQKRICEIISPVEQKVFALEDKINAMHHLKNAVTADLLSGRKRVTV